MQRSIYRTIGRRPSRLIVHRSLIATTSRTISYDGSCHRYSPIVRDSATMRRDRSRYATAAGDRSKHCRSVAPWPNRTIQKSYDPEIVRPGVNVASEVNHDFVNLLYTYDDWLGISREAVPVWWLLMSPRIFNFPFECMWPGTRPYRCCQCYSTTWCCQCYVLHYQTRVFSLPKIIYVTSFYRVNCVVWGVYIVDFEGITCF